MKNYLNNYYNFINGLVNLPNNFFYLSVNEKKDWFRKLDQEISKRGDVFWGINISRNHLNLIDDEFIKMYKNHIGTGDFVVNVSDTGLFEANEFAEVVKLRERLANDNINLAFSENYNYYSYEKTCEANNKITKWADEINNLKIEGKELSPLEKYYVAYNYVTRFEYRDSKNPFNSRNLISSLTGNEIVCVGYSKILEELCRRIGIECETQKIQYDSLQVNHMNCLVKIKDEKYGIDGVFYSDPYCDNLRNGEVAISHTLISYNDMKQLYKNKIFKIDKNSIVKTSDIEKFNKNINMQENQEALLEFLNKYKEEFSDYIDKITNEKRNYLFHLSATKKDYHKIIDDLIFNILTLNNQENNNNSNTYKYLLDINSKLIADRVLSFTSKKNLGKFKEKLFKEMETYIPNINNETYNLLVESYLLNEKEVKNKNIEIEKENTKDITLNQFEMLLNNLNKIEGESEIVQKLDTDKLIINSAKRAKFYWGEFRSVKNVFSRISDFYTILIRDNGKDAVNNGEQLLNLYRNELIKSGSYKTNYNIDNKSANANENIEINTSKNVNNNKNSNNLLKNNFNKKDVNEKNF